MANRRMFSKYITNSDSFLDLPSDTKVLYFYLGMEADDDGFVAPKRVARMLGVGDDNLKLLIAKGYVIPFEEGVVVITHWNENNLIRSDRYTETKYTSAKATLSLNNDNHYTTDKINTLPTRKKSEKPSWLVNRQAKKKASSLPYSFEYKIKKAFYGEPCPVCNTVMESKRVEHINYSDSAYSEPTIQHNVPLSQGGKHELGNISVICHSCNVSLRNKTTGTLNANEVIGVWNELQSATSRQPVGTTGKDRLGKDSINTYNPTSDEDRSTTPKNFQQFIVMFNQLTNRSFKGDSKSLRNFRARLKEGYTREDFELAIQAVLKDKFHKENGFAHLTPEFITRSDKLERFLEIGRNLPTAKKKVEDNRSAEEVIGEWVNQAAH